MQLFFILCMLIYMLISPMTSINIYATEPIKTGEYIMMGEYYNKPILWRCVGEDENGILVLSDDIICYKEFDSRGDHGNGSRMRTSYGSSVWSESNIRCWLNSDETEVNFVCGNPPTYDTVWLHKNPYDKEPGFLTNFDEAEKNAIKEVQLKTCVEWSDSEIADGKYNKLTFSDFDLNKIENKEVYFQYTNDKIFLLDEKQLKLVLTNLGKRYLAPGIGSNLGDFQSLATSLRKTWILRPACEVSEDDCDVLCVEFGETYEEADIDIASASMSYGIRPAFYLNDDVSFVGGCGTGNNPYIISGRMIDKQYANPTNYPETIFVENATEEIKVFYGEDEFIFTDAQPFLDENDRTLVPIRTMFEELGYEVVYNSDLKTVTVSKGEVIVQLCIDSNEIFIGDKLFTAMDTKPQIINDRVHIPLRYVADAIGFEVVWRGI